MKFRKYLLLLTLFLVAFIPLFALFHPGLPLTHDGQDHVARIANFYQNLKEGNIIPRWAGNLNWGYGHPILEFLYPFPSYLASLFHFLGFSFINSTKIVFGLGMFLSGLFMYLWLSELVGVLGGFIGATLYMFTPYRFVELYVRGDIGENLAFAFIPLVFYFLLKLSKKIKVSYIVGGAIALGLLILSHNAVSLMSLPLIAFYGLYLVFMIRKKKAFIFNVLLLIILGFGLSAFFWLPGLLEAKYTLRNIVTAGSYSSRFVNFRDLLYGPWSYGGTGRFTVQLGIINWIALLIAPFIGIYLYKKRDKRYLLILGLLAYFLAALFLMLKTSNFIWQRLLILQNFQFPWRFLAIPLFTTSALLAIVVLLPTKKIRLFLVLILLITILFLNRNYWHAKDYLQKEDSFFTGVYNGTTDTGESAPVWSVRFMEKSPSKHLETINGQTKVNELKRQTTYHKYEVFVTDRTRFVENTLYFPGWIITVDQKPVGIEFQDPSHRGLMTFYVEPGGHIIEVMYQETKIRRAADLISAASLIIILLCIPFSRKNIWQLYR